MRLELKLPLLMTVFAAGTALAAAITVVTLQGCADFVPADDCFVWVVDAAGNRECRALRPAKRDQ